MGNENGIRFVSFQQRSLYLAAEPAVMLQRLSLWQFYLKWKAFFDHHLMKKKAAAKK